MRNELFRRQALESIKDTGFGKPINMSTPGMILISTVLLFLASIIGLYLYLGEYTRTAIVIGILEPETSQSVIRTPAGGVVQETNVELGDYIPAGTTMVRIEHPQYSSEMGTNNQLQTENLSRRLAALHERIKLTQTQHALEEIRIQNRLERLKSRESQLHARLELNTRARSLAKKRLERAIESRKRGLNTIDIVENARLASINQSDEHLQLSGELDSLKAERLELEKGLELRDTAHQIEIKELRELELTFKGQLQELTANTVTLIKAPISGYVSIGPPSPGQLLSANEIVTILLPSLSELEARVYVPSSAIGFVQIGQQVSLKYDAFPYQRYGNGTGRVVAVASAALLAQDLNAPFPFPQGIAMYPVTIKLDDPFKTRQGVPIRLLPDMTLRADIILDRIRIYEWLLDPIYRLRARLQTP